MWIKQLFLGFFGLCAGGMTAAGVFAFLAMIGILPRLIGKTGTKRQTRLYETMMILGGSLGNAADLFPVPLPAGRPALAAFGGAVGIFVGCLVMSLAETLKALPVMNRRIRLAVVFPYVVLWIGIGKMLGSLFYFYQQIGG